MDPSSYSFQQSPLMSPNIPSLPNSPNSSPYPTSPNSPPKSPLMPPNLPKSPMLPPQSPYMPPNLPSKSPYMPPNLPSKSPYMPPNLPSKSPYMPPNLSPYTSPTLSPSNSISNSMSPLMPPNSTFSKSPVMSPNSYVKSDNSPLTLLVETEEEYLIDLKCLLQRVTASWNSDNPPPKKLDNMFCLIDKVYRGNRELYHRLKKIKQDPSTQSLVDVLMDWIDKMENPYTNYCKGYVRGIESLPEIEGNIYLQQTLNRQLRNLEPGSSENEQFANAIKRIDLLIDAEKRARSSQNTNIDLPVSPTYHQPSTPSDMSQVDTDYSDYPESPHQIKNGWTLQELEFSLDTTGIVDFVTKKPKPIKIDLLPPHLPFNRELILNADFAVTESDEFDNSSKVSVRAHLFLLTDLLLVCQRLSPEEKQINPNKEFYLIHPPFSGRYLSIIDNYDRNE
ncbi:24866_t:CDS:2, partial [Gigaspora rosea]